MRTQRACLPEMDIAKAIDHVELMLSRELAMKLNETEVVSAGFKAQLAAAPWELFVQSADYSYFVARVLLSQGLHGYGLFCAQQCVELYLKASIKRTGGAIEDIHPLNKLLLAASKHDTDPASFLLTPYAAAICRRFDAFYEVGRYPVQKTRPRGGSFAVVSGWDEQVLDYFVHRMRQMLAMPKAAWDILGPEGHMALYMVRRDQPDVYARFTANNVNFA